MHAKDRRESAQNLYNYAAQKLENEKMRERLAELKSQHEPLASLMQNTLIRDRELLIAAAHYVVNGRMP